MESKLAEQVYWAVADLLNLEVDLLFFDTTSTYFETGQADEPLAATSTEVPAAARCLSAGHRGRRPADGEDPAHLRGFRAFGKSKDHRDDLPQVIIGMAVTRTGIPIRVWSWPGATSDSALIRQVKDELKEWTLARVVWVADRGFTSAANRRYLQRGGGHYIIGEKLRSDSAEAKAALGRQGRYKALAANLRIKEVKVADADDRFVICHNPDQAERDAATPRA